MKRTLVSALVVAGFTAGLAAQGGGGRQGGAASTETLSQTFRESHGRDVAYQLSLPGFKIFDNLYHVGVGTVSTWLIPTTAGLIMIDSSRSRTSITCSTTSATSGSIRRTSSTS